MGSKREDGTRKLEAISGAVGTTGDCEVQFPGGELCSLQIPDECLVALHGTAADYTLFFKASIRRAP